MKRRLLYFSVAAMMMSGVASADILQINDLTDGLSVNLINNIPGQQGSISNVVVLGETVTFTYTLPAGLVFGANFNSFRNMLEGPLGDDDQPPGAVSDVFRAVWSQGGTTAAVSFSSDPDSISLDGATQLASITENGAFQSVVTVGAVNLDFQVASDVPEPSTLLECAGALFAFAAGLHRWRRRRS